jgi:integrase/recombinase XerD
MFSSQKFLSEQEDESLCNALSSAPMRDALMFRMLRQYGMRASELLALRKCDVDFDRGVLFVSGVKGGLNRELPILERFDEDLRQVCGGLSGREDRLFAIGYNRLGDIWRRYRPVSKGLHSLRHTSAVRLYQKSKDLLLVKRFLGHRSIETTMIYQDFVYSQEQFAKYLG